MFQYNKLKHIKAQYQKLGMNKSYFSTVSNADFKNIKTEQPWLDKNDSAEELPKLDFYKNIAPNHQEALSNWSRDGFVILENFLSEDKSEQINIDIEKLMEKDKANWRYQNKIMFALHQCKSIQDFAHHSDLTKVLEILLKKEVQVFQSINFLSGSEQKTHSDSIHMTTFPLGYMIGVWIALEDINEENGPLHYYPGSHKLPYVMNEDFNHGGGKYTIGDNCYTAYEDKIADVITENKLEKKVFHAKKGDVLIWHANLLHGGEAHFNKQKTRKSMVLHYFAKDVACYHEITQRPAFIK